jgi:hypothetical protein
MGLLLLVIQILRVKPDLSKDKVCSSMVNCTILLLLMSMEMDRDFHLVRWKMAGQQTGVCGLGSIVMGQHNM